MVNGMRGRKLLNFQKLGRTLINENADESRIE